MGSVVVAGGVVGCSVAGGFVLCVVVASDPVPLSLQAAMPNRARAETDARINFFTTTLLLNKPLIGTVDQEMGTSA